MAISKTHKIQKNMQYYMDAHHRLLIALVVAVVITSVFYKKLSGPELILLTWICFAFSLIVPQWFVIFTAHPKDVKKIAKLEDSSRTFIFLFVIFASLVSLGAIIFLLKSNKHLLPAEITQHVLLATGSVFTSWWLVHTVFTMRYAHLFYISDGDDATKPTGGLQFPANEQEPDYLDFVYFSFVIGMTFQVSDVEISSRKIRRLALLHALIAFAFNTAIVALSINVISGLIAQN
ncbi:DUF1345 domain-containing protein [Mucilaginibacter terrae]|uniref:DUF1345 domain-containing protein n=1 Tax=Mucilaginibacter terrae TaxID=1955052 RepID=UPI00362E0B8C